VSGSFVVVPLDGLVGFFVGNIVWPSCCCVVLVVSFADLEGLPAAGVDRVVIFAPKQYEIHARNTKHAKACNFILLACLLPQKYGCEITQKSIHKIRRK
jgi:hypothetical protein